MKESLCGHAVPPEMFDIKTEAWLELSGSVKENNMSDDLLMFPAMAAVVTRFLPNPLPHIRPFRGQISHLGQTLSCKTRWECRVGWGNILCKTQPGFLRSMPVKKIPSRGGWWGVLVCIIISLTVTHPRGTARHIVLGFNFPLWYINKTCRMFWLLKNW